MICSGSLLISVESRNYKYFTIKDLVSRVHTVNRTRRPTGLTATLNETMIMTYEMNNKKLLYLKF